MSDPTLFSPAGFSQRDARRVRGLVFSTVLLDMIGYGIVIPILPFYVTSMHGSPRALGELLSCFSLMQLLAMPVLGRLSDRFGRRPIILFSLAGNAASMALFAAAAQLKYLPLLFLSRSLAGATSGNMSACQAAIADTSSGADRAKAMGLVGAGVGFGMIVGPEVGGIFSTLGAWAPPLVAAAFALVDLVLVYVLLPETNTVRGASPPSRRGGILSGLGKVYEVPGFALLLGVYFLAFLCLTNLQVALALLARDRFGVTPRTIGHYFGLYGLIGLVMQLGLLGPLSRAFGQAKLVVGGMACVGAGLMLLGVARVPWVLLAGIVAMSAGMGVVTPSLATLASNLAPRGRQGAMLGVAQSAGGMARTVGPTLSGELYMIAGPSAPFFGGVLAAIVAIGLGIGLVKRTPSEP